MIVVWIWGCAGAPAVDHKVQCLEHEVAESCGVYAAQVRSSDPARAALAYKKLCQGGETAACIDYGVALVEAVDGKSKLHPVQRKVMAKAAMIELDRVCAIGEQRACSEGRSIRETHPGF